MSEATIVCTLGKRCPMNINPKSAKYNEANCLWEKDGTITWATAGEEWVREESTAFSGGYLAGTWAKCTVQISACSNYPEADVFDCSVRGAGFEVPGEVDSISCRNGSGKHYPACLSLIAGLVFPETSKAARHLARNWWRERNTFPAPFNVQTLFSLSFCSF